MGPFSYAASVCPGLDFAAPAAYSKKTGQSPDSITVAKRSRFLPLENGEFPRGSFIYSSK